METRKATALNVITTQEYDAFRTYLEDVCGIKLGDNKHYLVTSRLQRLLNDNSISNYSELISKLSKSDRSLQRDIVDAMTTNETLWFRDRHPFEVLHNDIFPELSKERGRPIKIWSAACSSGQEPYTISMVVHEFTTKNPGRLTGNVSISATDISTQILTEARKGIYDESSLSRGISPERKKTYFHERPEGWQLRDDIRNRVTFSQLNLKQSFAALGKFDIVFCRNVLIYFSSDLKRDIISRIARALNPGGLLFLGSSESITGHSDEFEMVRSHGGVHYRLKTTR